jgi:tetratricopeptide (TPR) repeat protein
LFALYPESQEIGVFNLHTTEFLRTISNYNIREKPFISPKDLTISPDGYLFISDEGKNSIIVLNRQGEFQDIINISGDGSENNSQIEGINCDHFGNLYVADKKNQRVIMFAVRTELKLTRQAQINFNAGKLEEAIEVCENLLHLNPQNKEAVEMIENSLRMMITKALDEQDNLNAKKLLQRFLDFNPSNKFAQRRIRLLRWTENKGWMKYAFAGLTCFLLFFALLLTIIEHFYHRKPNPENATPEPEHTDESGDPETEKNSPPEKNE